eukprot:9488550-Pyramimonas_sp.AAC.1
MRPAIGHPGQCRGRSERRTNVMHNSSWPRTLPPAPPLRRKALRPPLLRPFNRLQWFGVATASRARASSPISTLQHLGPDK